jgi:hypothetical protein
MQQAMQDRSFEVCRTVGMTNGQGDLPLADAKKKLPIRTWLGANRGSGRANWFGAALTGSGHAPSPTCPRLHILMMLTAAGCTRANGRGH